MDAVSAIYGAQRQEVPHKILTQRRGGAEERVGEMKKFILAAAVVALAVLNVQSATHDKVQLWEGGPYWATTNIGADNPWDYGLYFWWGDTTGHRLSADGTFSFSFDYYNDAVWLVDWSETSLAPYHDAAHVHWGGGWRMPTSQELRELRSKCNWTRTTLNGVKGFIISGKGDYASNSIFLPAAGHGDGNMHGDTGWLTSEGLCYVWSSNGSSDGYAFCLSTYYNNNISSFRRYFGMSVRPVQGFNEGGNCVIHFNANGGTGNMDEQTFEEGNEQKLSKNTYRKDGYVFQGWAVVADGEVVYKDEASITVDSDMTLYAVWATVTPESADWSMGSITLSATGFIGNSLEDISISYCNANTDGMVWLTPEGSEITKAWSADGKTLLVTDSKFSRRLDGVCPIKYRIVDKFGNAVDSPSMRNRHGLAVGVSKYDKVKYGLNSPEESESFRNDAELFIEIMERSGGGILHENMISLMDNGATTNAISAAWENLAETATIPGDLIFFYIATHGGNRKEMSGRGVVTAYDGPYTAQRFQSDLAPFKHGGIREGVKVVAIMANCHSESMAMPYGADDEGNLFSDSANILYVASASAEESSIHWGVHSQFALYFLKNGLGLGQADAQRMMHGQSAVGEIGNRDGEVNLLECARYAQELSTGWSSIFPAHVTYDFEKASVMADTILVAGSSHAAESSPGAPGNVEVRNWQKRGVSVCFSKPSNADFFKVYYQKVDDIGAPKWITSISNQCDIYTLDVANESYREREAQLMNGAAYRFWVVACGPGGMSDPSEYVEFTTPIENSRTYTVGFDANGARDAYGNPISLGAIVVPAWKEVGSLPELDWVGHTFVGWYFNKDGRGERVMPTTIIVRDSTCYAVWTAMTMEYLNGYPFLATASSGDIATAAAMTAANGCRTVGECYALGIDPEDPDDDFKVTHFEMKDGKPVITLNHTEDGSGNSFLPRVKTLGKADLLDAEWREVPEDGDDTMRFFKVEVEMP